MNLKFWLHHRLQKKLNEEIEMTMSDDHDSNEISADSDSEDMENSIETDNIFCQFINL